MIDMGTTSIGKRVRAERERRGWSGPRLAAEASLHALKPISKQVIHKLEQGNTESPTQNTIRGLVGALGVTQVWLLEGREPKWPEGSRFRVREDSPVMPSEVSSGAASPGYVRLPLLEMGGPAMADSTDEDFPEVVRHLDVADWWARQKLPRNLSNIRVVSARGDSMAGLINHGDVLFVDASATQYDGEGLYVFNWSGRPLVKRLAPNIRSGQLQLLSNNAAAYPPEDIGHDDLARLAIAGRVAAWWTLRTH